MILTASADSEAGLKSSTGPGKLLFVRALPWAVLLLSFAATLILWLTSKQNAEEDLRSIFNFRVRETITRIERRMRTYEQVLRGGQGMFYAAHGFDRAKFRSYATALQLQQYYPGIQGLGFAPLVLRSAKQAYLGTVRKDGFPGYDIKPAGDRETYAPVTYLEPFSGRNLRAFGYDMFSEPVRRAALEESRDLGTTTVSGKVTLVQETDRDVQAGFLIYAPVYRNGAAHETVADRRANIFGWVYAPFRMGDLMYGLQDEHAEDLRMKIFDGNQTSLQSSMYDADTALVTTRAVSFESTTPVAIAGHAWTVRIISTPSFALRYDDHKPLIYLLVGAGASVLLTLITWLLVNGQTRAARIAEDRDSRYQQLLQQANEAILLLDLDRRILEANKHAVTHFGYPMEELLTMYGDQLYPPEIREEVLGRCANLKIDGSTRFEAAHLRKDGSRVMAETSSRLVQIGGKTHILSFIRNIEDRRSAERALQESESRFRSLFENSPNAIFISDPESLTILDCNPKACTMNGYTRDELVGKSINVLHPNDIAMTLEEPRGKSGRIADLRKGGAITVEGVHRRKDGSYFPIESSISLISLGGKTVSMGIDRDITERKAMESALRKSEQRYRDVVNGIREVAFETDAQGLWTFLNPAWTEITGFPVFSSIGTLFLNYVHPDDRDRNIEQFRPLIDRKKDYCRHEIRYLTNDGGFRWIEVHARLILDEKGNAAGTRGTLRDITDQKKRQEESEAREELAMSFFTNQAAIKLLVDPDDGAIVKANPVAAEFYGYPLETLQGMKIFDINILSHETIRAAMNQAVAEKRMHVIFPHRLASGEIREVEVYSSGFDFRGKTFLSSIIHDVTEKRRVERELEASLKEKEMLIREVHHRVKNNLNVVASLLSMQSRSAKVKEDVKLFEEARDRILAMAHLHEKLYRSKGLSQVDLKSYVEEIVRGLAGAYQSGNVGIRLDVQALSVGADTAIPLGLIVNELVTNSFKYAFPETADGHITVYARRSDDFHLTLEIRDDGVGLPTEFDVDKSESLGLNLVSLLTKQLDGTLEVTRAGGTCFRIVFPLGLS